MNDIYKPPSPRLCVSIRRHFPVFNVRKPGTDEAKSCTMGSLEVYRVVYYSLLGDDSIEGKEINSRGFLLTNKKYYYFYYFYCYTLEPIGLYKNGVAIHEACVGDTRRLHPHSNYRLSFEDAEGVLVPEEYKGKALRIVHDDESLLQGHKFYICAGEYPHDTDGNIILYTSNSYNNSKGKVSLEDSLLTCKLFYDKVLDKLSEFRLDIENEDCNTIYKLSDKP